MHFDKLSTILVSYMTNQQTHAEKTAAADKSIGFDYQYYYFLYRLLKMSRRESVGLEVKDDVHTDLACNRQILIQLKHTVQKKADGTADNLTNYDSDLWKTLSNWTKVITDKVAGRMTEKSHLAFIKKTDFMLVSNKSETKSCHFLSVLEDPENARSELEKLETGSTDKEIKGYIQDILSLSDLVLIAYLRNIHLELETDDIIGRCKDALIEMRLPENRIEQVFSDLDSKIRQDNFIAIKNGEKIEISFDEFSRKYRRLFDIARSENLIINRCHEPLPATLEDQTFIKQLVDIGDIQPDDFNLMAEFTIFMQMVKRNLLLWQTSGELTGDEVRMFNEEARSRWQNKFRATYRKPGNIDPNVLAQDVLEEMRKEKLSFETQPLGTDFSNGEYYCLSDLPVIGWHQKWEEKHK